MLAPDMRTFICLLQVVSKTITQQSNEAGFTNSIDFSFIYNFFVMPSLQLLLTGSLH